MTRSEALARLRPHAPALRAEGVHGLSLFGSTARDEADAASDIDLVIDVDFAQRPMFDLVDLAMIQMRLTDDLGVPVQVLISRGMTPRFRARIEPDLIPIF